MHEALKLAEKAKKEEAREAAAAAKALLKEERQVGALPPLRRCRATADVTHACALSSAALCLPQTHDTRRAHTDARHQAKREERKETGKACEHGVWRCKIW